MPMSLGSFPCFNSEDEDEDGAGGECPFPRNPNVFEDFGVEVGDVYCWEDGQGTNNH